MSMTLNNDVVELSNTLHRIEGKFGVNQNKLHMLRMLIEHWDTDRPVRITDVLGFFKIASRATTHRMVRELVSSKLLHEQISKTDRREKYLVPGSKFDKFAKAIKEK